jgi:hypothetical protein
LPDRLVVKKGSKMRGSASAGIPVPVSGHRQHDVRTRSWREAGRHVFGVDGDARQGDVQSPTMRHGIAGVDHEVHDDLLELGGIHTDVARGAHERRIERDVLAQHARQELEQRLQASPRIHHPRLDHLPPAEGQELSGQLRSALRRLERLLCPRGLFRVGLGHGKEQRRASRDDREQVVEVVRDAAGATTDGFQSLRMIELLGEKQSLLFQPFERGDVAPLRDEQRGAALFVTDGLERKVDGVLRPLAVHVIDFITDKLAAGGFADGLSQALDLAFPLPPGRLPERLAHDIGGENSAHVEGGLVHVEQCSFEVQEPDQLESLVEDAAETPFAVRQLLLRQPSLLDLARQGGCSLGDPRFEQLVGDLERVLALHHRRDVA